MQYTRLLLDTTELMIELTTVYQSRMPRIRPQLEQLGRVTMAGHTGSS